MNKELQPKNSSSSMYDFIPIEGLCFCDSDSFVSLLYYHISKTKLFDQWFIEKVCPTQGCKILKMDQSKPFLGKNVFLLDSIEAESSDSQKIETCFSRMNQILSCMEHEERLYFLVEFPEFLFFNSIFDEKILKTILKKKPSFMKNVHNIEQFLETDLVMTLIKNDFPESLSWVNNPSQKLCKKIIDHDRDLFYFISKKVNMETIEYAIHKKCLINGLSGIKIPFSFKVEAIKNNPLNALYLKHDSLNRFRNSIKISKIAKLLEINQ